MSHPAPADVAASLSPRQTTLNLWREYVSWTLCRRALAGVAAALEALAINERDSTILLENALMYTLLAPPFGRPDALLRHLSPEALERGLDCIPVPDGIAAETVIDAVRDSIARAGADAEALLWSTDQPTVSGDDASLRIGEFSIDWSRPVAHAYQHLLGAHDPATAGEILLRAALRYDAIFARTRHIGPPQAVYDAFYDWGVRNEGFASPFNARLLGKPDARFFSAFPDTDAPFGAAGSFFQCSPEAYDGAWCLDPPFLPSTMDAVDAIISRMRARAEAPAILLIVPASHSVANRPDETVHLQAGVHVVEGLGDSFFTLPVDVTIHRYGELPGFSAQVIQDGYRRPDA